MKKHKIDKELKDFFRLYIGILNWCFDDEEIKSIVPNELTHTYLLNNFIVNKSIIKYYYLATSRLIQPEEINKLSEPAFKNEIETALGPFSVIIYGAYFSRSDLEIKLSEIYCSIFEKRIGGKKVEYFEDLKPYFNDYAIGFENGFHEFESKQINPFLTMFSDKEDYVNKVFEYVTKNIFLKHSWHNLHSGFCTNGKNEIINAFEDGQAMGFFYKAWSMIFSNHKLYTSLFTEHLENINLPTDQINYHPYPIHHFLHNYPYLHKAYDKVFSSLTLSTGDSESDEILLNRVPFFALHYQDIKSTILKKQDFYEITGLITKYYLPGFKEGLKTNYIPFIDTNESRVEKILDEALVKVVYGLSFSFPDDKLLENGLFDNGVKAGRCYGAWSLIFKDPGFWDKEFKKLENKKIPNEPIQNAITDKDESDLSNLTTYELALRHWYLVECKEESFINAKQVGEKYHPLKHFKNIQVAYLKIDAKDRKPKRDELINIHKTLNEYTQVQKAILNDIDLII